jgi:hypothetical protein
MAEFKAAAAASFSIDDLEQLSADGEETPDLLIIESGNEKFRDSSDAEIDDKIRTYEGYLQDTKLLLKNKGKLQQHLEDLRTEQKFRMNRQSRLVASSNEQIAQQDTGNTPRNSQQRNGTRSMSLNGLSRGFMTSSTVKVSRSHDSVKFLKLKCDQASQGFLVQIVLFWWDFLSYDAKFYPLLRQFIGF